jgi:hypothetical protein
VNGVDHPLSKRATQASPQDAAKSFLESKLGVSADGLVRKNGHVDNRTRVANEYFRQQFVSSFSSAGFDVCSCFISERDSGGERCG